MSTEHDHLIDYYDRMLSLAVAVPAAVVRRS
jgi:hypothetical protein